MNIVSYELMLQKDDDTSQIEALSDDSSELEHSLQVRSLRIATLESKMRTKEAQVIAAMNPRKRFCHTG